MISAKEAKEMTQTALDEFDNIVIAFAEDIAKPITERARQGLEITDYSMILSVHSVNWYERMLACHDEWDETFVRSLIKTFENAGYKCKAEIRTSGIFDSDRRLEVSVSWD